MVGQKESIDLPLIVRAAPDTFDMVIKGVRNPLSSDDAPDVQEVVLEQARMLLERHGVDTSALDISGAHLVLINEAYGARNALTQLQSLGDLSRDTQSWMFDDRTAVVQFHMTVRREDACDQPARDKEASRPASPGEDAAAPDEKAPGRGAGEEEPDDDTEAEEGAGAGGDDGGSASDGEAGGSHDDDVDLPPTPSGARSRPSRRAKARATEALGGSRSASGHGGEKSTAGARGGGPGAS